VEIKAADQLLYCNQSRLKVSRLQLPIEVLAEYIHQEVVYAQVEIPIADVIS
jgi:hypothetical protein